MKIETRFALPMNAGLSTSVDHDHPAIGWRDQDVGAALAHSAPGRGRNTRPQGDQVNRNADPEWPGPPA
jgi:hypothetical protein